MNMADFVMPTGAGAPGSTDAGLLDTDIARVGAVAVRRGPIADIASGSGTIVVSNFDDDSVSLLDADTLAVRSVIRVPGQPFAITVRDDRAYVSTSSLATDAVSVIDTESCAVIGVYSLDYSVTALAVSPDGKRVYAGRTGDGHVDVAVIDVTAERVGTIDIATRAGVGIDAVEVDPTGKRLYVAMTDAHGSSLAVVATETARVERVVWIGTPIRDVAVVDGTAFVLTSDRLRGSAVHVVDVAANRITDTVELGVGAPTQLALSQDRTRAYIVDYDHVAVLCTLTQAVVDTLTLDARPSCVAVDSDAGRLYVADYASTLTAFSVASALPMLYSELVATDPIVVPRERELQIATA